jgi:hypothetical protein
MNSKQERSSVSRGKIITVGHNVVQILTWSVVAYILMPYNFKFTNLAAWRTNQYWDDSSDFRYWLEVGQTLQVLDIVLSALKMTKNSLASVFPQIVSRLFILHMIFPLVESEHFCIFVATICWAVTEVTRFTFYTLKELNLFKVSNPLAELIGHMRYNSFIFLYPIGVSGELICCFKAW